MAFFHVLITEADSPKKTRCILSDLSELELRKQFVGPYRNGKDVLCGSEVIQTASIKSVRIIQTQKTSEVERKAIHERSLQRIEEINRGPGPFVLIGSGHGYDPEDIAEAGDDVMRRYLKGPPGYAKNGAILAFLSNAWIVTIGAGLILAALLCWLGWN